MHACACISIDYENCPMLLSSAVRLLLAPCCGSACLRKVQIPIPTHTHSHILCRHGTQRAEVVSRRDSFRIVSGMHNSRLWLRTINEKSVCACVHVRRNFPDISLYETHKNSAAYCKYMRTLASKVTQTEGKR